MAKVKKEEDNKPVRPVFFDPTSRRYALVIVLSVTFLLLAVMWAAVFTRYLYDAHLQIGNEDTQIATEEFIVPSGGSLLRDRDEVGDGSAKNKVATDVGEDSSSQPDATKHVVSGPIWRAPKTEIFAFIPAWPQSGLNSLKANFSSIDVVLPEWYTVSKNDAVLEELPSADQVEMRNFLYLNSGGRRLLPVVTVAVFRDGEMERILGEPRAIQSIVSSAVSTVLESDFDGICFDLSGADPQFTAAIVSFATHFQKEMTKVHRESCLVGHMADALWKHPLVHDLADELIVLGFREPGPFSAPAPLAPQDWFEQSLSDLTANIDPDKLVIGIGGGGFDWVSGTSQPELLGYYDVTAAASLYGAKIRFDPASQNTAMSYTDENGRLHQVWLLDALSTHNQLLSIPTEKVGGVAIWPNSHEDPGVWTLLDPARATQSDAATLLKHVEVTNEVRYIGKGALLTIVNPVENGVRDISVDPATGLIDGAKYLVLPNAFTIKRYGYAGSNAVVLTFDDGPSEEYTPKILNILRDYDVPAVFFVVGARVLENPEIVQRILREGHELGVHTYSHPNLGNISDVRLKFELHASQELIAGVINQHTLLFRAPYGIDENPKTLDEAKALKLLSEEGYVIVGVEIDSKDWTRPGAEEIVENVLSAMKESAENVVLMHDAGGDRSQTVQALGNLIESLRANGFTFVPLSSVGQAGAPALMEDAGPDLNKLNQYSFQSIRLFNNVVTSLFYVLILAGISRTLIIIILALLKNHRPHACRATELPVTVVIPAFCEETVIAKTIEAVLASDYPNLEVIVVDDGSTDETARVIQETFESEPRVRLVSQKNRGKAEALNHAFRIATSPIVVGIDADTIISPDAIGVIVGHFYDPEIGAVAGNVKVGNRRNFLTRLQAIEYISSQNLDRRAYEALNGIMVIPGAIGAWRKAAVDAAGGFTSQTLVEDADITVSIIRAGYRVIFEPKAHAYTEAPETIRQWMRQRLRWTFGMLQIAWKHKGAFIERRAVGLVSIPDLVIFGALVSLFAPLADFVLILNVFNLISDRIRAPHFVPNPASIAIIVAYLAYLLSDLVLAALALSLEPEEDKRLLVWALTQRFFYRQIHWIVVLRSIGRALTGRFTGWRKITRTATVSKAMPRASRRIVSTTRNASD